MRFHACSPKKRRNKNNINNRIDDNRNIKHLGGEISHFCVGGCEHFAEETFMFEMHISTEVKIYSNWRIKTFIFLVVITMMMLSRNDNKK